MPHLLPAAHKKAVRAVTVEPDGNQPEPGLDPTLPSQSVPGSVGHQARESPNEDEDDEGRSVGEQLVEDGAKEAEHDKVRKATRVGARDDQSAP